MTGTGISCFSHEGDTDGGNDARLRRQLTVAGGTRPVDGGRGGIFQPSRLSLCLRREVLRPEMSAPWGGRSSAPAGSGAVRTS
jgi:hypothetical protein